MDALPNAGTSVILAPPAIHEPIGAGPGRRGASTGSGANPTWGVDAWYRLDDSSGLVLVPYDFLFDRAEVDLEPVFTYPEDRALEARGFVRINDPRKRR